MIGVYSREGFETEKKDAQKFRAAPLAIHFAHVVRGNAKSTWLRTSLEYELKQMGCHIDRSHWRVKGHEAAALVRKLAADEGIRLLTAEEAIALEKQRYDEIMQRHVEGS